MSPEDESDGDEDLSRLDSLELEDEDDDEDEIDEKNPETSDETDDPTKPAGAEKEKRKRRLRMKRLKKRAKARAYEFTGGTDVVGIVFLEICKITDLPPERNSKRTVSVFSLNPADHFKSDEDIIRHGSIRGSFLRQENIQDSGHPA